MIIFIDTDREKPYWNIGVIFQGEVPLVGTTVTYMSKRYKVIDVEYDYRMDYAHKAHVNNPDLMVWQQNRIVVFLKDITPPIDPNETYSKIMN